MDVSSGGGSEEAHPAAKHKKKHLTEDQQEALHAAKGAKKAREWLEAGFTGFKKVRRAFFLGLMCFVYNFSQHRTAPVCCSASITVQAVPQSALHSNDSLSVRLAGVAVYCSLDTNSR